MCDTFVVCPEASASGTMLAAKSADTEVNEAQVVCRQPRRRHAPGRLARLTHISIPEAEATHACVHAKSFWPWGVEIGFNEHGLFGGDEAVWTIAHEAVDGVVILDLLRLMLERAATAREAIEVLDEVLFRHGQGGNCELRGNSHFDGSYLLADATEAFVVETAGRHWAALPVARSAAISNALTIGADWALASAEVRARGLDFAASFHDEEHAQGSSAPRRHAAACAFLAEHAGRLGLAEMAALLRHHEPNFAPGAPGPAGNICMHAAPGEHGFGQATGAMIVESGPDGVMGWVTATAATCLSLFKPVFADLDLPAHGPAPAEQADERSLWWRHERLHRRAIADFACLQPEIRASFDAIERAFFDAAAGIRTAPAAERQEFMAECWRAADAALEGWLRRLDARPVAFRDAAFAAMWDKFNRHAGFAGPGLAADLARTA